MAALNLAADDVHIVHRSYLDPQVDLRNRLKAGRNARRRHIDVHAVRGVSFELRAGESLGLIGHNGAGKSTLLLGLAGLLPLTSGAVSARSRPTLLGVASVLNMALSGRRNIEIGCLAMGMPRHEVTRRIDELVEFAGLEDAIDLPLKAYSSGMRARLSFTVATVDTPEVLLIDEALAVGDAEFRAKATARLEEIRRAAGSVIIVSHNMGEIERMCDRALWLDHGAVVRDGTSRRLISLYAATRSNPDLMASLLDDEAGPVGPVRPMTLQYLKDQRYLSAQIEPWEIPDRAVHGGFPSTVAEPEELDTSVLSASRARSLTSVHSLTERPHFTTEGALLRDWLFDPATGVAVAEWPSSSELRQAIALGETLPRFIARDHGEWHESGGHLFVDREIPRVDPPAAAVYCWTRWPEDPLHWWTDVASRAVLASSDERLAHLPLLMPPLTTWRQDALISLGIDPARTLSIDAGSNGFVRFSKLYFPGALTFGAREAVSLDKMVAETARRSRMAVVGSESVGAHRRLYVPRKNGIGRRVVNHREFGRLLGDLGFETLPDDLSFEETVRSFASAEMIVAPSGGSLFGSLFASEGASIVELQPETLPLTTGRAVSQLVHLSHSILCCPAVGDGASDAALAVHDDIEVPISALRSMVERLTSRRVR